MQFQVRDAAGADKDLRLTVERAAARLPGRAAGALLFTCNGRGRRMFGVADHDASTIEELLGGPPAPPLPPMAALPMEAALPPAPPAPP